MPQVGKAIVRKVLMQAAKNIVDAAGPDGVIRRRSMRRKLLQLEEPERALAGILYGYLDHRDGVPSTRVTRSAVDGAVLFAEERLIQNYDLDAEELTPDELGRMSIDGLFTQALARELKAAAFLALPTEDLRRAS